MYVSRQVEAMLGHAPEGWLVDREFLLKILHPDDRKRVLTENRRTNESGGPYMEYCLIACDGRTVRVRDEVVLVRDEEGHSLYWHGVMTDVTERRALEERLQHQVLHDSLTDFPTAPCCWTAWSTPTTPWVTWRGSATRRGDNVAPGISADGGHRCPRGW